MYKLMESKVEILLIYTTSSRKMFKKAQEFMEDQLKSLLMVMDKHLST
jgi:hypothetical protein